MTSLSEDDRLRRVIEATIENIPHYKYISASDIATDLIPAILDEFDSEFEKAWQYDQLSE